MKDYQEINHSRMGLQLATAVLFYAASRYAKVENIGKATIPVALSAIAQGFQPKVRNVLGGRTKKNGVIDLLSLGLIAIGMRYAKLAQRTQILAGGALFGSQIIISNAKVQTFINEHLDPADRFQKIEELFKLDYNQFDAESRIKVTEAYIKENDQSDIELYQQPQVNKCLDLRAYLINDGIPEKNQALAYKNCIEFCDSQKITWKKLFNRLDKVLPQANEIDKAAVNAWLQDRGKEIRTQWSL